MYSKATALLGLLGAVTASETGNPEFVGEAACFAQRVPHDVDGWRAIADDITAARDYALACCDVNPYDGEPLDESKINQNDDLYIQFVAQELALNKLCKRKLGIVFDKERAQMTKSGRVPSFAESEEDARAEVGDENSPAASVAQAAKLLKKFRNLKAMVMILQPANVTTFGRYCYYGCWCLPAGQHNLSSGFGAPVDPIDEVCKEFALCYKCLDIDFAGQCDPDKVGYMWARNYVNDVVVDVTCKNDPTINSNHRCARYVCECDRILAVGFGLYHWRWNINFHARWGSFDRMANCFPRNGNYRQDACCGGYGTASDEWGQSHVAMRRPYATTNPSTACCQDVFYYDFLSEECCLDSNGDYGITAIGDCVSAGGSTVAPDA
jgi:hypothetical protein